MAEPPEQPRRVRSAFVWMAVIVAGVATLAVIWAVNNPQPVAYPHQATAEELTPRTTPHEEPARVGPGSSPAQAPVSTSDSQLQQKWNAWYARQSEQDCVPPPYDEEAIEAVRRGHAGDARQFVHGPKDPFNRRAADLVNIKTRPNPKGRGILVSAWKDMNRGGSADYSRRRSVWLVLDGKVYPINQEAAGDVGRLYDGLPDNVQKVAGLIHTYERGRTMMDQLGIESASYERRFSGGNPFPTCR
jgi:hypothetical protein